MLGWERENEGYEFSFSRADANCIDAEVRKGYDAMCGYFNEKNIPELKR